VNTLVGGMSYFRLELMGWYYRPATNMYEFWWQGPEPKISLAAEMLDVMPMEIVMEIKASATVKRELTD